MTNSEFELIVINNSPGVLFFNYHDTGLQIYVHLPIKIDHLDVDGSFGFKFPPPCRFVAVSHDQVWANLKGRFCLGGSDVHMEQTSWKVSTVDKFNLMLAMVTSKKGQV